MMCTPVRRIPASANTDQGPEKRDLVPFDRARARSPPRSAFSTSPQSWSRSSFSITWMRTTTHRIPTSAYANQRPEKRDLVPFDRARARSPPRSACSTSPKLSFSTALICTTLRRIPASADANQGLKKTRVGRARQGKGAEPTAQRMLDQPSEREQIVLVNFLDSYLNSPDSSERQYNSRV